MLPRSTSLVLSICLFLTAAVSAQEAPSSFPMVRIGYVDFPPFTYTDSSGAATGTLNALSRQVLRATGIPHQFVELPAKRIAKYIRSGEIDIFQGVADHPAFKGEVLASETLLTTIRLMLYHRPQTPGVEHYHDLQGRSVVMLLGYSYGDLGQFINDPDNNVSALVVSERESAIRAFEKGRADYLLDYSEPASVALGERRLQYLRQSPLAELPTRWVVSQAYPRAEELIETLDRAYRTLPSTVSPSPVVGGGGLSVPSGERAHAMQKGREGGFF